MNIWMTREKLLDMNRKNKNNLLGSNSCRLWMIPDSDSRISEYIRRVVSKILVRSLTVLCDFMPDRFTSTHSIPPQALRWPYASPSLATGIIHTGGTPEPDNKKPPSRAEVREGVEWRASPAGFMCIALSDGLCQPTYTWGRGHRVGCRGDRRNGFVPLLYSRIINFLPLHFHFCLRRSFTSVTFFVWMKITPDCCYDKSG